MAKFYAVYGRGARKVAVREGFAWWAALLTLLWTLYHRLWRESLALVLLSLPLPLFHDIGTRAGFAAILALLLGCIGGLMRRARLERTGFTHLGVYGADSARHAVLLADDPHNAA